MLQKLSSRYDTVRDGANNGFIIGGIIVFLILIGLPAGIEGREDLAPLALPLFIITTIGFSIFTVRQFGQQTPWSNLIANGIALGVGAAIVFLLFMAFINRWQARGFDVQDYFAEVTLETTSRLSGVPEEELFANPEVDSITQERPEGSELRTNPLTLTINDDHITVFNLGFIKVGGLYGTGLVIGLIGFLTMVIYHRLTLVDWQALRASISKPVMANESGAHFFTEVLPFITHWLRMIMPLLLFVVFWLTIPMKYDTAFWERLGDFENKPIFDLGKQFDLGIESTQKVQLMLGFAIIVAFLLAWRNIQSRDYSRIPWAARAAIVLIPGVVLALMGYWRVWSSNATFINPSLEFGSTSALLQVLNFWTIDTVITASVMLSLGTILAVYSIFGTRSPYNFESAFFGVTSIGIMMALPLFMDQYQSNVLNLVSINIVLGLGLNIVVGYAGLLDLGYVAFFAIGAYSYAFVESNRQQITDGHANSIFFAVLVALIVVPLVIGLATVFWARRPASQKPKRDTSDGIRRMSPLWRDQPPLLISLALVIFAVAVAFSAKWLLESAGVFDGVGRASPFMIGLALALIASAFAGVLLGFPVLRLRSDYLAIVTLGFGEIISISLENLTDITGGPFGALNVPKPLPKDATVAQSNLVILYLAIMGAAVVTFLSLRLRSSRLGRAWTALRSDEDISQAMGINLVNAKLLAFAIGATFAGASGLLFASNQSNLFPSNFNLEVSIRVLTLVIIGGMGSVPGVIVGAIALVGMPEILRFMQDYRYMAFGGLLVAMMLIRPGGLFPTPLASLEERARRLRERHGNGEQDE